jgi:AbiU2
MVTYSPDEAAKNYQKRLGESFGKIYYACFQEFLNILIPWRMYENLFGHSKERVDLLNECGGAFFYQVEKIFFHSSILGLCRLSDPKQTSNKKNLTVKILYDFMDSPARKANFTKLTNDLDSTLSFQRNWRNKLIAHNDLSTKLSAVTTLNLATRLAMNESLDAFKAIFSYIHSEFLSTSLSFDIISSGSNEVEMLRILYFGLEDEQRHRKEARAAMRSPYRETPVWVSDISS